MPELKFIDHLGSPDRCKLCLFCLAPDVVREKYDNTHEDCALEQLANERPESLNCWRDGREDGRVGYWTI